MSFPESERVLYDRNPLAEVICQLRFPPILRIDSDVADFQEAIRGEYPLYAEEQVSVPGVPPEIAEMIKGAMPGPKPAKKFGSADGRWTVALTREFVALQTSDYVRWEEFRGRLRAVLDTTERIFRPAFYTRVGLRYRDVIRRSRLALDPTTPWSQLLKPHIAGELATEIGSHVTELTHVSLIRLAGGGSVRIRHGLSKPEGQEEQSYSIDTDFFTVDRTELPNANDRLDYFNQQAARLFRWCIADQLHRAMGPRRIEPTDV